MGNENTGRKVSKTVGNRKKLLDITNTPILSKSRIHNDTSPLVQKGALDQLQEELANVKKMLEEKEENLAESKSCIQKLWSNYCRKSKQNEEIIIHNSQLYKELSQARDQLKVLQHENIQMSAVYKVCKSEMQGKLNEALEEINRLTKLVDASSFQQASNQNGPSSLVPGHSSGGVIDEDSGSIHGKSVLRKRERTSYKEPSLKVKLRQMDGGGSTCLGESIERESNPAVPGPAESQGSEAVAVSAARKSEMKRAAENGLPTKASQPCTEKGQTNILPSSHEVCERPRRRAASSTGSYREPPLNTKMRRAA